MIYAFVTFPGKREREQQIALSSLHFHGPYFDTLSTSQRAKKVPVIRLKKIVFGALLTQQKIRCHYFVVNKIIAF